MKNSFYQTGSFNLNAELSSYLNFLRAFAAFVVLLGHIEQDKLYMSWLPLSRFKHEAVVIFFVMSGLIIYWTTSNSHLGLRNYFIARASRIYSVAFPAVIISTICAFFAPADMAYYKSPSWWDIISSLLFLNESWQGNTGLVLNGPYWSLCYEVWYYVLFGLCFFIQSRIKWIVLCFAACIAGPSILALFPLWVAGALIAKGTYSAPKSWANMRALEYFFGSIILIIIINISCFDMVVKKMCSEYIPGFWRLQASQRFLTDYLVGLAVVVNILAFERLPSVIRHFFIEYKNIFDFFANFSFTLYLFHSPFTRLLGAYYPNTGKSIIYSTLATLAVLFLCCMISYGTEKQLKQWRRIISKMITRSIPKFRTERN